MDEHEKECARCQAVRRAAWALSSKRLGKHERRQLLGAGAPDKKPKPIYPPGPSQAEQTATRRAIANLVAHGLIRLAPEQLRLVAGEDDEALAHLERKYAVLRQAWRTELGEEIVRRYRKQLRGGERIRWMYRLDSATEAALSRCPDRNEAQSRAVRAAKQPTGSIRLPSPSQRERAKGSGEGS
jgi:hypothetical protein